MGKSFANQDSRLQQAWIQSLHSIASSADDSKTGKTEQALLEHLVTGLGGTTGSLAILEAQGSGLAITAATGSAANFIGKKIAIGEGIIGRVASERRPLLLGAEPATPAGQPGTPARAAHDRPSSAICWPLLVEDRLRGVVCVNRMQGEPAFAQADVENGQFMVNLLAVIVENVYLHTAQQLRIADLHIANQALEDKQQALTQALTRQRESEARLSAVIENTSEAILSVDEQGRIVLFNRGAENVFGYTASELLGGRLEQLLPERFAAGHGAHLQRFAQAPEHSRNMRGRGAIQGRRKSGHEFPAEASISKASVGGQPLFTVFLRDISERILAEAAQARLTAIIEGSTDIIGTADANGGILYMNAAGCQFFGLGATDDITGMQIADVHPPWALSQARYESIPYAIRDGAWSGESELCNRAGTRIPISQLILAHRDADGRLLYLSSVMRDISERKVTEEELRERQRKLEAAYLNIEQAQSQLLQSEKMASVGQLAAGVAHEINNPVGYIASNLNTLKGYIDNLVEVINLYEVSEASLSADPEVLTHIQAIKARVDLGFIREDVQNLVKESQEGVERVKRIVQDLKEFSHVDRAEWQEADLHAGLDSTLNMVHNELKYKAEIIKDYGSLPAVECIPAQINQVFMNLLVNAGQAIEARGVITLRSGCDGDRAWVEVADSGKGMPADVVKRIFEPFFTTKPVGKGTGLGLSLSYGIVQKHNGEITVTSVVGQGTTFRITLPVCRMESKPQNTEFRSTGT